MCGGGGAGWARVGCIWLVKVVGERGVTRKSEVVAMGRIRKVGGGGKSHLGVRGKS